MNKKAFSLIELSLVLLVIGILTVAITKGSSLIDSARLSSARSLTASSGVDEIDGISAWYETTLNDSIAGEDRINNNPVAYWQDVSSQYNIAELNNQLIGPDDSSVVYRSDGIGKIPSLQFTSSGNLSLTSLTSGHSNIATVFAVLSPTLAPVDTMTFLDSQDTSSDNGLGINSSSFTVDSVSDYSLSATFQESEKYVLGIYLNDNSQLFLNDVNFSTTTATSGITGFNGLNVGTNRNGANNFTGLISEIIIYDKLLTSDERRLVMSYLAKKYKIRVEGASL